MTVAVPAAAAPHATWPTVRGILLAGLAGGSVDFLYACAMGLLNGRGVLRVWQGVASGWLGPAALRGGFASAALGVATHFGIAALMAGAYAAMAARAPVLYRRWPLVAPVYGIGLYLVMYRVVLPLRFAGAGHWRGWPSVADVLAHVGVALALAAVLARAFRQPTSAPDPRAG